MAKRKRSYVQHRNVPCPECQVNANVWDFSCALQMGHGGPCRDPVTGTFWRHRSMRPFRRTNASYDKRPRVFKRVVAKRAWLK